MVFIEKNILPKRKKLRVPEYDYSAAGAYFITICTKDRKKLLSEIKFVDDIPILNLLYPGVVVEKYINAINNTYKNKDLKICNYIVMPNHIHMICMINDSGSPRTSTPTNAKIPFLISTFKRMTSKECVNLKWQRNYYEHIIRNDKEFLRILEYIEYNPYNWTYDKYFD